MLTRRDLIKLGLAGTGYVILGPDGRVSWADDDELPPSPHTTPFIAELPVPPDPSDPDAPGPRVPFARPLLEPFPDFPAEYQEFVDANTDFFMIANEERRVSFHPDLPETAIWGYRDLSPLANPPFPGPPRPPQVLGPTLLMLYGALRPGTCERSGSLPGGGMMVRHVNRLSCNHRGFGVPRLTVHLHGGHHPARADGFPGNIQNRPADFPCFVVMEPPGFGTPNCPPPDEPPCSSPPASRQVYDYYYPTLDPGCLDHIRGRSDEPADPTERPSTMWYHDHVLDFTGQNAYRGLAGFVLAFDELDSGNENNPPPALGLPSLPFDIPLAIQDKQFAADGSLVFNSFNHDGFLGDKFLVNGAIQPFLVVQRRKYRFRFLNASNARIYQFFLTNSLGQTFPMTQIATEGGLLARPIRGIRSFMLSMAERVEVVIDFSNFSNGTRLYMENRLFQKDGRKPEDELLSQGDLILQFRVVGDQPAPDPSRVPDVLRPLREIPQSDLDNATHREFRFDRSHGGWTINNELAGHLECPIASPGRGQPEIWHLRNNSGGWWHPIHIHSEFFRVLRRNGKEPPLNSAEHFNMAKKDTILLRGNEEVEVLLKFRDHLGPFVFHCHNMEHEDMAMMARFDVVEPGTVVTCEQEQS